MPLLNGYPDVEPHTAELLQQTLCHNNLGRAPSRFAFSKGNEIGRS